MNYTKDFLSIKNSTCSNFTRLIVDTDGFCYIIDYNYSFQAKNQVSLVYKWWVNFYIT
jgi:hypothetical protein